MLINYLLILILLSPAVVNGGWFHKNCLNILDSSGENHVAAQRALVIGEMHDSGFSTFSMHLCNAYCNSHNYKYFGFMQDSRSAGIAATVSAGHCYCIEDDSIINNLFNNNECPDALSELTDGYGWFWYLDIYEISQTWMVNIDKGTNLQSNDDFYFLPCLCWISDPGDFYVEVDGILDNLGVDIGESDKTDVKDNDANPTWHEQLTFGDYPEYEYTHFQLHIKDEDGSIEVPGATVWSSEGYAYPDWFIDDSQPDGEQYINCGWTNYYDYPISGSDGGKITFQVFNPMCGNPVNWTTTKWNW